MMISLELLRCVADSREISVVSANGNRVSFSGVGKIGSFNNSINIYELAHKCKEWARRNGLLLTTCPYEIYNQYCGNDDDYSTYTCYVNISQHENGIDYDFEVTADTEPEAIFKACQNILDKSSE